MLIGTLRHFSMDRCEAGMKSRAVTISDLCFSWKTTSAPVLRVASLSINSGERLFVEGPSGSGKTTLLGLLAGNITPQQGTISVLGECINTMSGAQRDRFRADHIGFIFQMFNLIPYLSVVENVTLPCRFSRRRYERANGSGGMVTKNLYVQAGITDANSDPTAPFDGFESVFDDSDFFK